MKKNALKFLTYMGEPITEQMIEEYEEFQWEFAQFVNDLEGEYQ